MLMTIEEYGNLLKYLGVLKYAIHKMQHQEREWELKKEILQAIDLIVQEVPILEEYIKN